MRYCIFCGVKIPEDAKFCQSCGKEQPEAAGRQNPEATAADTAVPDKSIFRSAKMKLVIAAGSFIVLVMLITGIIIMVTAK